MAEPTLQEWMATEAVRLAEEGDTEAARDILRGFVDATSHTHKSDWPPQLPVAWIQYLADAFRRILDEDADPARALGIKATKAGRPPGAKTYDDVRLAAAYWLLRRRGHRPEQANERIRDAVGADRTTVQKAADKCSGLEDVDDDLLVAIVAEQPALQQIIPPPDISTS